jgi:hypothetical protein
MSQHADAGLDRSWCRGAVLGSNRLPLGAAHVRFVVCQRDDHADADLQHSSCSSTSCQFGYRLAAHNLQLNRAVTRSLQRVTGLRPGSAEVLQPWHLGAGVHEVIVVLQGRLIVHHGRLLDGQPALAAGDVARAGGADKQLTYISVCLPSITKLALLCLDLNLVEILAKQGALSVKPLLQTLIGFLRALKMILEDL